MTLHEKYIDRCLQLAHNGLGRTYPNPMVGSVVVLNDRIIGEGWHRKAGQPHAEVHAINTVKDRELLKKATIYVSLEPCSHYGKTPPCSNLIIDSGIKKVVIGTVDPFSEVAGKGIKKLLDSGCEVIVGVRDKECQALNRRFFTFHTRKRPYVILKWAQTSDRFISPLPQKTDKREPFWISNEFSKQLVHKWRSEEQGILVGTNTALADNPMLNTRLWHGENPVRIVLDRQLRIPRESHLFDGKIKTIVLCGKLPEERDAENIIFETLDFSEEVTSEILKVLVKHEIQSLIVEGGRRTLQTFIDEGNWDEARIFTGKAHFNKGIKAPEVAGRLILEKDISGDNLKIYRND